MNKLDKEAVYYKILENKKTCSRKEKYISYQREINVDVI